MSNRRTAFSQRVLDEVRRLRPGEVVSYGEIARRVGSPSSARAVGRVLANSSEPGIPWWLVVTADGGLVDAISVEQTLLLQEDGVAVIGGRVPRSMIVTP